MSSWQARGTTWAIEALLRCVRLRDPWRQARWARRLSRIRHPLGWLSSGGLTITPVRDGSFCGEWVEAGSPAGAPGVILYLHGGGYVACSPLTHRPITATLAGDSAGGGLVLATMVRARDEGLSLPA